MYKYNTFIRNKLHLYCSEMNFPLGGVQSYILNKEIIIVIKIKC